MVNGKHGQGTQSTKMGADKSAENITTAPRFICPNCLPKPKSLGFWWKTASLGFRSPCSRARCNCLNTARTSSTFWIWKLKGGFGLSWLPCSGSLVLYYNASTEGGQKYYYCKIEPPQSISSFLTEDLTSISALSLSLLCIITKEMPGVLVWYGVQHLLKEIRDKSGKKCVNLIETWPFRGHKWGCNR